MSLPDAWTDRIFDKLALVYGHQFLSRWDGMDLTRVKADWAHELRGLAQSAKAIAYGLEHLPAKPPTVLEFRAICTSPQAPRPDLPLALPRIAPGADEGSRTVERIKRVQAENPGCGRFAWALALEMKDREEPGRVTPGVRATYRDALANYRARRSVNSAAVIDEELPWQ
jgi:hypothetical protein